jgi:hypothetical protein
MSAENVALSVHYIIVWTAAFFFSKGMDEEQFNDKGITRHLYAG